MTDEPNPVMAKLHAHVPFQPSAVEPCRVAIVDLAPGVDDLCTGRIWSGYLGKLAGKALRLANIDRAELLITYLFDHQLPDDDIKGIGYSKWLSADYLPTPRKLPSAGYLTPEMEAQFARVADELFTFAPAVVMPMGPAVLWAFTDATAIGKARGTLMRASHISPGSKLLPTLRPGHVHRQYKMLGTWVSDFKRAMAEAKLGTAELTRSRRELWLAPTLLDMEIFFDRYLRYADCITVDIETAKGQITDVGFGANSELAISIPFVDYRQPNRCYWSTEEEELAAWGFIERVLQLPATKQFQNGPYDCFWFARAGIHVVNWCKDTRLLHHALYPELPKSLYYMSSVYCQEGPWKLLADHSHSEETFDEKRDA
jgi:uracil-DNA glycosylase